VVLRPRTGTNSFGIEAAGDTTLTNADIATINTSNFVVLGSGIGTTFTGNMTIGQNAQVNGGGRNLAFFRSTNPGGTTTIGSQGVATTGDVIVSAGGGAIVSNGGTVAGDEVQLRAGQGIGAQGAPVQTAANALAVNNGGGLGAFVREADDVVLRTVTLNVGGMSNVTSNFSGTRFELASGGNVTVPGTVQSNGAMNLDVGGTLTLSGAGIQDAQLISSGGQTISAQSLSMLGQSGRRALINNNVSGNQTLTVGAGGIDMNVIGGAGVAQIADNAANTSQTVSTTGALSVVGGSGSGSTNSGVFGGFNVQQTVNAGSITLRGATAGNSGGAFISNTNSTNTLGSADQAVNVTGGITIVGGENGLSNRAGIVTNGNQTITGNPDITMTGGASGTGTSTAGNSVFITTNGTGKQQTINAGTISVTAGSGGTDTGATITAAKQLITTTGDVLISGGGGGGDLNGARIGGLGGATPGATDLTLNVGRDLVISGGSANGASVGSTVAAATAHTVAINAARDVILNASAGAPVRIGTSFNFAPATGDITVTAGRDIQLNGLPTQSAAIRTAGAITLTADSLSNAGSITNGGGASTANIILNGNAFNLVGGTIDGGAAAVVLRPRTGTNSFGIEAAGDTTLTNADIATINTSNFVVLGSGIGTTFTGNMTIGQNAQVNGGGRNLAFFRSTNPGGTTTIGSQGVATTGDVIVSAGGGAIVSNGGTVAGDEVQLRAGQGIGAQGAPVQTAANALAVNNGGGLGAFVREADDVVLRTVTLNVGGMSNVTSNFSGTRFELASGGNVTVPGTVQSNGAMNLDVGGTLTLSGAGIQDAQLISSGGQTISAQSLSMLGQSGRRALINNNVSGNQTLTVGAGGIDMNVIGGAGVAQIADNAANTSQTVSTTGALSVVGGSGSGSTNSGVFGGFNVQQTVNAGSITLRGATAGNSGGAFISNTNSTNTLGSADQAVNVTGGITIVGGENGLSNRAGIVTNGNQTITGNPDITMTGGASGTGTSTAGNSVFITTNGTGKQQTINAGTISVTAGSGGTDTVATITAAKQLITTTAM
jgi:hypothetical protein